MTARANDNAWTPVGRGERRYSLPEAPVRTNPPTMCTGCFTELQAIESVSLNYETVGYRWEHVDNVEVSPDELHRPTAAASRETQIALVRAAGRAA